MAQQVKNPPAMQETQVVDCKFMCQIQSEARQTKMLEFGAERFTARPRKENGGLC